MSIKDKVVEDMIAKWKKRKDDTIDSWEERKSRAFRIMGVDTEKPKSLRDEFAMAALKGLIIGNRYTLEQIAEVSYKIADFMIEERQK
jgi:hypothetical protein